MRYGPIILLWITMALGCTTCPEPEPVRFEATNATEVIEYGEPVNGLQVGLEFVGIDAWGRVEAVVHLKNVGQSPLMVWDLNYVVSRFPFEVHADGQVQEQAEFSASFDDGGTCGPGRMTADTFAELKPGETRSTKTRLSPWPEISHASQSSVAYVYRNRWPELFAPLTSDHFSSALVRVGPLWTGEAKSGALRLKVVPDAKQ